MCRSKFSEHQDHCDLESRGSVTKGTRLCRENEVSEATYYQWKSKHGRCKPLTFGDCESSRKILFFLMLRDCMW